MYRGCGSGKGSLEQASGLELKGNKYMENQGCT
jgi:hypothetical protein